MLSWFPPIGDTEMQKAQLAVSLGGGGDEEEVDDGEDDREGKEEIRFHCIIALYTYLILYKSVHLVWSEFVKLGV